MKHMIGAAALALLGSGAIANAQKAAPPNNAPNNAVVDAVVRCKAETDAAARLRCYDAAAGALSQATASGSIVVIDREDVRKTRRSLFGFTLPKLPFFSGDDSQNDQADEIEAKLRTARGIGYGKWVLELDTGAKWQTTEPITRPPDPKAGEMVKIKRGAMGGYFLSVEGRRGVRALRVG